MITQIKCNFQISHLNMIHTLTHTHMHIFRNCNDKSLLKKSFKWINFHVVEEAPQEINKHMTNRIFRLDRSVKLSKHEDTNIKY